MKFDVEIKNICNKKHKEFFKTTQEKVVFYGGAGSGKSYSVVDRLAIAILYHQKPIKIVVVRKTLPSLRRTCVPLFEKRFKLFKLHWKLNKSEWEAKTTFGAVIILLSVNNHADIEKLKSLTDVDYIWVEEATEIHLGAFEEIDRRLRGSIVSHPQIFLTFNPVGKYSWCYQLFFEQNLPCKKVQVTVYDNPWAEKSYIKKLEDLKKYNYNLWLIYCKGEFGELEDIIFTYSTYRDLPDRIDNVVYGQDYGWNSPSALLKIQFHEKDIFCEQLHYAEKMKNSDIIASYKEHGIKTTDEIYADHKPDAIDEASNAGFNIKPAVKDEKKESIKMVQGFTIHVHEESTDLIKELDSYVWKRDKDGNILDEPVKFMDHLCDCLQYGVRSSQQAFKPQIIYAN